MKTKIYLTILTLLILLLVSSCAVPQNSVACTKEFVSITLKLEDTNAKPVSAQLSSRLVKINQEFAVQETAKKGTYIVLDDSFRDKLSTTGDELELNAVLGRAVYRTQFIVAVDKNRCHVKKISGPEKLVIPAL